MVAAALAVVPFLRSAWLTLIPMGMYAVGAAIFMPSMSTMVAETAAPHERGAVLGAFQGMGSLGRVLGPLLASATAAVAGLNAPFVVAAGVAVLGAILVHPRRAVNAATAAQGEPRSPPI
jgi:MFS family permease